MRGMEWHMALRWVVTAGDVSKHPEYCRVLDKNNDPHWIELVAGVPKLCTESPRGAAFSVELGPYKEDS